MEGLIPLLASVALAWPVVLILAAYDARWAYLAAKHQQPIPWGVWSRMVGLVLGHGGAALILAKHGAWPAPVLKFWVHMALDPALCCYAYGLYDLAHQAQKAQAARRKALEGARDA